MVYTLAFSGVAGNGKTTLSNFIYNNLKFNDSLKLYLFNETAREIHELFKNTKFKFSRESFQSAIMAMEFEKLKKIKEIQTEHSFSDERHLVIQDRSIFDNIAFASYYNLIDTNSALRFIIEWMQGEMVYYDTIVLFQPIDDENQIKKILKDDVRKETIDNFKEMQKRIYNTLIYVIERAKYESIVHNVLEVPSIHDSYEFIDVYNKIMNTIYLW